MLFLIRRSAAIARARDVASGDDDVAGDVEYQPLFGNRQDLSTREQSRRRQGRFKPIAVLVIHVDWEPHAHHSPGRARRCRRQCAVRLLDCNFRMIAASDGRGLLAGRMSPSPDGWRSGFTTTAPVR
jgi:hypothetical protein